MSFSKQWFRDLCKSYGIENVNSDFIGEVFENHTNTQADVVKVEIEKANAENKKVFDELQGKYDTLLANQPDTEAHANKITELEGKIAEYEKAKTRADLETQFKAKLEEANIDPKRFNSILKITDVESLDLSSEELVKNLQTDFADFVVKETTQTHTPATPPQTQTQTKIGRSQIAKMTPEEINKAWADGKIDTTKE